MSVFAAEFNELLQDNGESIPVGENSAESTEEKEVYALGERHLGSDGRFCASRNDQLCEFFNGNGLDVFPKRDFNR